MNLHVFLISCLLAVSCAPATAPGQPYGPAGGYSYTRFGTLQSTDGLAAAVGKGAVSVKFEKAD